MGVTNNKRLTLLTLCLAVLVAQVDMAVVNLATRPIGNYFHAGVGALQWVLDAYNLVYAVLLLTGGLLADLYGRRRIFTIGVAIFTAASLLCAVAPSIGVLIAGRALAGLGAALSVPASLAIIRVVWRDEAERGHALGIWAGCNGLAMAIGPTVGGLLIGSFGWRSIFLVVVPFGVAALALARPSIPESSDPQDRSFDAPAQALGALALGGLALAAIESQTRRCRGGRLHRRPGRAGTVPADRGEERSGRAGAHRHLPRAAFRAAIVGTTGMTFGMYGVLFLLPLTWQSAGTLSAIHAGLALMPMALVFVVLSPFSGWLRERLGGRTVTAGGVAVIGLGLLTVALGADHASIAVRRGRAGADRPRHGHRHRTADGRGGRRGRAGALGDRLGLDQRRAHGRRHDRRRGAGRDLCAGRWRCGRAAAGDAAGRRRADRLRR